MMRRIFTVIIVLCCFLSCQTNKENNTIVLTDFTKELIALYFDDIENLDAKNRKDEIIISTYTDKLNYYLCIHSNNPKSYEYCRDDFVGDTLYMGHLIRVFGEKKSIFYTVKGERKEKIKCSDDISEYDPNVWHICFYKDLSFCKMRTSKLILEDDISLIQDLAGKYFKIPDRVPEYDNFLYENWEIEVQPSFLFGDDSLRRFISSNFTVKKGMNIEKLPDFFTVYIIVDKNGNAQFKELDRHFTNSGNKKVDKEAIRITKKLCQHKFIPATLRGEKVNAVHYINFYKDDIIGNVPSGAK